jgi:hypothetical protein
MLFQPEQKPTNEPLPIGLPSATILQNPMLYVRLFSQLISIIVCQSTIKKPCTNLDCQNKKLVCQATKIMNQINYNNQIIDFDKSEIPDSHVEINVCLEEGKHTRISISSHEFILKMISWAKEISEQEGFVSYSVGK